MQVILDCQLCSVGSDASKKASIIYFGEVHQNEEILKAQLSIMYHINEYRKSWYFVISLSDSLDLSQQTLPKVHLVLEFFNFGQQKILDRYTQAVRQGIQMNDGEMVFRSNFFPYTSETKSS